MSLEIVMCGGPYNGSSVVVTVLSDVEVITDLQGRRINVYRRDSDALAYYWDKVLSELYTNDFDAVYAKLSKTPKSKKKELPNA